MGISRITDAIKKIIIFTDRQHQKVHEFHRLLLIQKKKIIRNIQREKTARQVITSLNKNDLVFFSE